MGVYKGGRGHVASEPLEYQGMHAFETWFGESIPRGLDFVDDVLWGSFDSFEPGSFDDSVDWLTGLTQTGRWPLTTWHCTYSVPMVVYGSTLAEVATGAYDEYFAKLARNLYGTPEHPGDPTAIIRIGWEMNGWWYPWKLASQADAANFRAAWIHIVDAMRAEAPGLRFDFCPAFGLQNFPAAEAYPGDAYVDFIGLDVYNQTWITPVTPATRWNDLLNNSYGIQFWADFAAAHGKPLSYPEWGTGTRPDGAGGGDDPFFIQNMFNWLTTHNVAYHNYWDYPADDFNGQLSNGQFPNSGILFKTLFDDSYSIASGPTVLPAGGTYGAAQSVTLSTSTPGASMRYTLDGSTPSSTTGTPVTGPVTISATAILKAIAYASGHSSSTVTVAPYTIQIPAGIPSTPSGLGATAGSPPSDPQVFLFWNASNGAPTSYHIKRAPSGSGPFTTIGTSSVPCFADPTAVPGTTYAYAVSALNSLGESANSISVNAAATSSVTVDDADLTGVTITGSWTSSTSSPGFYGGDYRHDGNTGTPGGKSVRFTPTLPGGSTNVYLRWTAGDNRASNAPVSVTHAGGTSNLSVNQQVNNNRWFLLGAFTFNAGTGGYVQIGNTDANGFVVADAVRFTAPPPAGAPAAPTSLAATSAVDRTVSLSWTAVSGATRYLVKRAWSGGGAFNLIGTTTGTTWTDQGLTNGTNYDYAVSAVGSAGESANSTVLTVAPVGLVVMVTGVSSGRPYIAGVPAVGSYAAIDRTYTISALSTNLADSRNRMILPAYEDKAVTANSHLTFSLNRAATVYVCYDGRMTTRPAFLNSTWTLTTETFSTTHTTASPFKVYSKPFPAGSVTLGGTLQSPAAGTWPGGQNAPYFVIIR
jgi:hypothetical protein